MATTAAINQFKLSWANPALEQQKRAFESRANHYNLLWACYNNSVFNDIDMSWQTLRGKYGLYRNTRGIYNPTTRLVDFYPGAIYPGALSEDGEELPGNIPLAIPFSKDTDKRLKKAVAQIWQWTNFQSLKDVGVIWGGALGSVFIDVRDDVEKGKVYYRMVWPGYITDLELDSMDNVKAYTLSYEASETVNGMAQTYIYTEKVDKYFYQYFKDEKPFDYGQGAVVANPYGFVPAVWIKFYDVGALHGLCAFHGSLTKVFELNSKASQLHDYIGKMVNTPFVLGMKGGAVKRFEQAITDSGTKRGQTDEFSPNAQVDREEVNLIIASSDTPISIQPLVSGLDIAGGFTAIDKLIAELEHDFPELTFYQKMQEMTQATGPAISRLSGNTLNKVTRVAANYDRGYSALFQMAVAIAGMRYKEGRGGWANATRQRKKFSPFSLDSYAAGDLDMAIMPRDLIPPTELEQAQQRQTKWLAIKAEIDTGIPLDYILKVEEGWTEQELAELEQQKQENLAKQQEMFGQQGNNNNGQDNGNGFNGNQGNGSNQPPDAQSQGTQSGSGNGAQGQAA